MVMSIGVENNLSKVNNDVHFWKNQKRREMLQFFIENYKNVWLQMLFAYNHGNRVGDAKILCKIKWRTRNRSSVTYKIKKIKKSKKH
jgi:hypothetical protein